MSSKFIILILILTLVALGGSYWSFKPIGTLKFQSSGETSPVFGGPPHGPIFNDEINVNFPSEYLTSITGTYGIFMNGAKVIKSLCFYTNTTRPGVFGTYTGTPFKFGMEGCQIVGFHGQSSVLIDAISVHVKPIISFMCKPKVLVYEEREEQEKHRFKHESVETELNSAHLQLSAREVTITTLNIEQEEHRLKHEKIERELQYAQKKQEEHRLKNEEVERELNSARLQLAASQVTITTLKTEQEEHLLKHEEVERELNSARLQLAAHQVTITTLNTKINWLMKIIIVSFTGLVFWFFFMKMLPYIWSFSILVTMLGVKMISKLVSDAVDGWVLNISVYICTYLISKIFWS